MAGACDEHLDAVDSLLTTCVNYCVKNLESVLADRDDKGYYHLKPELSLPVNVCESVLKAFYDNNLKINDELVNIFADPERTRLCRARLRDSYITDDGVAVITKHNLIELDLTNCSLITSKVVSAIDENCPNLLALCLSNWDAFVHDTDKETIFNLPRLRILRARNLLPNNCINLVLECFVMRLLQSFSDLHVLDVSHSSVQIAEWPYMTTFTNLSSLIMFDSEIQDMDSAVEALTKLKSLKHLDISQDVDDDSDNPVVYSEPEKALRHLIQGLPNLISLDISGTNLAGLEPSKQRSHRLSPGTTNGGDEDVCPIVGLEGRSFNFLGLFRCAHQASHRANIPALQVAGDADEVQMLVSLEHYVERSKYVERILDDMFHLLRVFSSTNLRSRQFQAIVNVMERHLSDHRIQISASASLFYVTKSGEKIRLLTTMKQRRRAVSCLLSAMEKYPQHDAMTRNGCLTLCNFEIPTDVRFVYERVVRLLLSLIKPPGQEDFVRRIGIYLLNSLACQVDGSEKQLIGKLRAVELMLDVINDKMRLNDCDEILEVSWSTLWNITDETPINCERFLNGRGMELFIGCLETFRNKNDLLRNMMGLMGNIAEVKPLRPQLMVTQFVTIFSELLESNDDGIEVSYNAAGVLSHMLSDGDGCWTVDVPDRDYVCSRVEVAIERWTIESERNINYRSFEPILRLLAAVDTPCVQYWAAWALCNLTTVYPDKYCELLKSENGLDILAELVARSDTRTAIRTLAQRTIETTSAYRPPATYRPRV